MTTTRMSASRKPSCGGTLNKNVMTVFEHQRLMAHDFVQTSDFHWLLAQELSIFSIKRRQGQWQLKVGHYIGIVLLPSGQMLEILPKLMTKNESRHHHSQNVSSRPTGRLAKNSDIQQTRHWVQNMLSDLVSSSHSQTNRHKLPHRKNFGQFSDQLTPLPMESLPLSDWLVQQFLQVLAQYEPTKHYQTQVHNQTSLQGRLLVKEQLRHNSMQPHRFVCEISMMNHDMLSNRLIKSALVLLMPLLHSSVHSKTCAATYLRAWQSISALSVHETTRLESIYHQAKRQLATQPLQVWQLRSAQQLVDLAYWLLRQSTVTSGHGFDSSTSLKPRSSQMRLCLLLDMNQAFEQWASLRIAAMFQRVSLEYKPLFQAQSVWLNDAEGQVCLSIRPDLLICDSGSYSHVVDIKWKHLMHAGAISASDAYQLTSYGHIYQAGQVWLVYPVQDDRRQPVALNQQTHHDNSGANTTSLKDSPPNQNDKAPAQLWLIPFNVMSGTVSNMSVTPR